MRIIKFVNEFKSNEELKQYLSDNFNIIKKNANIPEYWDFNDLWEFIRFSAEDDYNVLKKIKEDEAKKLSFRALVPKVNKFVDAFSRVSPLIIKSADAIIARKERESQELEQTYDALDLLLGYVPVKKKQVNGIDVPVATEFKFEGSNYEKELKSILMPKLKEIRSLLSENPHIADSSSIVSGTDNLLEAVEENEYKRAIAIATNLFSVIQNLVSEADVELNKLKITKEEYKGEVFNRIEALLEKMDETEQQLYSNFFDEEQAQKEEKEKEAIKEGTYAENSNATYEQEKIKQPIKASQIGISAPLEDRENKSLMYEVPMEKEEVKQPPNKVEFLQTAFKGLTEQEKYQLLRSLLKREKIKEVN